MQIIQIVNSLFQSNTYILSIGESIGVWLVDMGDIRPILKWMSDNGKKDVIGVLLTHTHFDHIYGLNDLRQFFPDCYIYVANEIGYKALFDSKLNHSKFSEIGTFTLESSNNVFRLDQMIHRIVLWKGLEGDCYPVEGHSHDSVCYHIGNYLFTGDSFIPNIRTVSKLKEGNRDEAADTVRYIVKTFDRNTFICPWHKDVCYLKEVEFSKMV